MMGIYLIQCFHAIFTFYWTKAEGTPRLIQYFLLAVKTIAEHSKFKMVYKYSRQSLCTPGRSLCTPGQSLCISGQSICTPGWSSCTPGQSLCTPGQSTCTLPSPWNFKFWLAMALFHHLDWRLRSSATASFSPSDGSWRGPEALVPGIFTCSI